MWNLSILWLLIYAHGFKFNCEGAYIRHPLERSLYIIFTGYFVAYMFNCFCSDDWKHGVFDRFGDFWLHLQIFLSYGLLLWMSLFKLFMTMWAAIQYCISKLLISFDFCWLRYITLISGFKVVRRDSCCSLKVDYKGYRRCCKDTIYWTRTQSKWCC